MKRLAAMLSILEQCCIETQPQLPAPQPKQAYEDGPNPLVLLTFLGIGITWVAVLVVGVGISHGGWAAWWAIIAVGTLVALCGASIAILERRKQGQLHKEDLKDREHHRKMIEKAIAADHSAEHITATSSFRAISKYMGPAGSLTIKDNAFGQGQLPAGDVTQPRLGTLIDELTPNTLSFPFGVSRETGELVTSSLQRAVHLNTIGDSGGGKSMGAMGILTALATTNDPEHLSLAFVDAESETTLPFHHLPHVRYLADSPRDAAAVFPELVQVLKQRHITNKMLPFILLFCEEVLTLKNRIPESVKAQALDDFTELACGGRKRNIALYTIGQTAYSDKAIRDAQAQFQTNMAYAIHPQRARAAGFVETPLLNQLYKEKRQGQFVLEHKGANTLVLAPHIDIRTMSHIVVPTGFPVGSQPVVTTGKQSLRHQD